jgi:hypothetical protein
MPKNQSLKPIQVIGSSDGENGWYAETSDHHRMLGPFLTRQDCLDAIAAHGARLSALGAKGGIGATGKSF